MSGGRYDMTRVRGIDLRTPLRLRSAFAFPLQTRESRREVLIGAALLLLPGLGWLLNMGHRIQMVHNMQAGVVPWPSWRGYGRLLKYGTVTFLGMVEYYLPAIGFGFLAGWKDSTALLIAGWQVAGYSFGTVFSQRFDLFDTTPDIRR